MKRTADCLAAGVAALLMIGSPAKAANPTPFGSPGDNVADLILSGTSAVLDTDGLVITGFVLKSLGNHFQPLELFIDDVPQFPPLTHNQNDPGLPSSRFLTATAGERSSLFFDSTDFPGRAISGVINLGQLYNTLPGGGEFSALSHDLDFVYNVSATPGIHDGNLISFSHRNRSLIGLTAAVNDVVIRGGGDHIECLLNRLLRECRDDLPPQSDRDGASNVVETDSLDRIRSGLEAWENLLQILEPDPRD